MHSNCNFPLWSYVYQDTDFTSGRRELNHIQTSAPLARASSTRTGLHFPLPTWILTRIMVIALKVVKLAGGSGLAWAVAVSIAIISIAKQPTKDTWLSVRWPKRNRKDEIDLCNDYWNIRLWNEIFDYEMKRITFAYELKYSMMKWNIRLWNDTFAYEMKHSYFQIKQYISQRKTKTKTAVWQTIKKDDQHRLSILIKHFDEAFWWSILMKHFDEALWTFASELIVIELTLQPMRGFKRKNVRSNIWTYRRGQILMV